jgi:YVTN family beta-propeller protein
MAATTLALSLVVGSWPAAADPVPLVVLSHGTATKGTKVGSVTFYDPVGYERLGSVDVGPNPVWADYGPDGRLLYVVNGGKTLARGSYVVKGHGSLSVIDPIGRRAIATVELGYRPLPPVFSPDGTRIYVLGVGKEGQKAVLTAVDRETHSKIAEIETANRGAAVFVSPSGKWLYLLHGPWWGPYIPPPKFDTNPFSKKDTQDPLHKEKKAPPKLLVVDAQKMETVREDDLASRPVRLLHSRDGGLAYLLSLGKRNEKDAELHGKLYIADTEAGRVIETVDAGFHPLLLRRDPDSDVFYLAGHGGQDGTSAVHVIDGSRIVGRIELQDDPLSMAHRAQRLYLASERSVSVVDLRKMQELHNVPLGFRPDEIHIDPDGRRAYVGGETGSNFAVIDLEKGQMLATPGSGRAGVRAGKDAAAAAATAVIVLGALFGATPSGGYSAGKARTQLTLRDDGAFLYVLNTKSNDITVIDTEDLSEVGTIPTGPARALVASPNRRHLYVLAKKHALVIDTATNEVIQRHEGTWPRVFFEQQRGEIFLLQNKLVQVLSLDTSEVRTLLPGLRRPLLIVAPP